MTQDIRMIDMAGMPVIDNTDIMIYYGCGASIAVFIVVVCVLVVKFIARVIKFYRHLRASPTFKVEP